MAAYRRVDDLRSPAGWLPVHRDQLRAQHSVSSMGSLYLYLLPMALDGVQGHALTAAF